MKRNSKVPTLLLAIITCILTLEMGKSGLHLVISSAQAQSTVALEQCKISEKLPSLFERAKILAAKNNAAHPVLIDDGARIICRELASDLHERALKLLMTAFYVPNSISVIDELSELSGRNKRLAGYWAEIGKSWDKKRHGLTGVEVCAFAWTSKKTLEAIGF